MSRGLVEPHARSRPRARALGALAAVGCFAVACGTDVAQTAVMGQVDPLDCTFAGEVVLPNDDVFGDGSEPTSLLVGQSYTGGERPGLFITARDAFRVYLNGALVVESTEPRRPVFVPLSLLPGDNALAVVVASVIGAVAATMLQRYVIIVGTAFGGAWTMLVGVLNAVAVSSGHAPNAEGVWIVYPLTPLAGARWVPVAWLVLGMFGTIVQLAITSRKK